MLTAWLSSDAPADRMVAGASAGMGSR